MPLGLAYMYFQCFVLCGQDRPCVQGTETQAQSHQPTASYHCRMAPMHACNAIDTRKTLRSMDLAALI